ncbi:phosphotransferase family protein [Amycolatopsis sp. NBC_00345]|uniref:phosphotransferase family protein n=1 Tax=Amycolatopsis sp. NBC_00345 TaxID=2975955 RepID=UPI002E25A5D4
MSWEWTPAARRGLTEFLEARGLTRGPVTTRRIGDGHSNLTYLVSDGERQVVLRRPPPPPVPPGAHDMMREARLIGALRGTEVPVARLLATADAGQLLDVPCYVMGFAAGPVVTTRTPPPLDQPRVRTAIGYALVDTLAALHAVDWRAAGLADLGRPTGFTERHLRRITGLAAGEDGVLPATFAPVHSWLTANIPAESGAALIHNDYRIGNVVLSTEEPGRIEAVLDWELAAIGDPLFDLGYFLASVPRPGVPRTPTEEFGTALLEPGYPSREDLEQRYAARTGANLAALGWYRVFALWKLAALYEYGRRRAGGDPYYQDESLVRSFLREAHDVAGAEPGPGLGSIERSP